MGPLCLHMLFVRMVQYHFWKVLQKTAKYTHLCDVSSQIETLTFVRGDFFLEKVNVNTHM